MNWYTKEIMRVLNVPVEKALAIQDIMDRSDLDFSECTSKQFYDCMEEAHLIYMNEEEKY